MEIRVGDIKLTAEDGGRKLGCPRETYIHIEVLGNFDSKVKPIPKVLANELKAAIDALEKACWRD